MLKSGHRDDEVGGKSKEKTAMRTIGVVICALMIASTLDTPTSAQVLDFTTIDIPGATATLPRGINPEGDIVGFYGVGAAFRGFLLHQGIVTDIEVPGASATRPRSINPQGDIVGFYVAGGVHPWLPGCRGQLHHH
jgi:hypothetical protein